MRNPSFASQSARWCFTWNNPPENAPGLLEAIDSKYLCYGREVAPTTGTVHLQGYVVFKSNQRLSAVTKKMPGCHVLVANGTTAQNIEYCSKDGQFTEHGEPPLNQAQKGQLEKERWQSIIVHAKAGTLEEHDPKVFFHHYSTAQKLAAQYAKPIANIKEIYVYWGDTGTGKSHTAWEQAGPDAYGKDPKSKFWYGYSGQENIVIDEFRGSIDIDHVLRWWDKYPQSVEVKNSSVPLAAKKIWITSNLSPDEWYPNLDSTTKAALRRRFTLVTHFGDPFNVNKYGA